MQSLYTEKFKYFTLFSARCPDLNGITGGQHGSLYTEMSMCANSTPRRVKSVVQLHAFLNSALDGVWGQILAPAAVSYPSDRLGGYQSSSGRDGNKKHCCPCRESIPVDWITALVITYETTWCHRPEDYNVKSLPPFKPLISRLTTLVYKVKRCKLVRVLKKYLMKTYRGWE
jgi:hypothetical protein